MLAALLLAQASCAAKDTEPSGTLDKSTDTQTAQETTVETEITTGLEAKDFGGAVFTMLHFEQGWNNMMMDAEAETGETLNDAIYKRNRKVEEMCNVVLKEDIMSDISGAVIRCVSGDSGDFDVAWGQTQTMMNLAKGAYLLDLYEDVPYIDLSKPWWTKSANDSFSIINRLFVGVNDISLSYFDSVMPLAMNMRIAKQYGLDDPYELVRSGKWTMDAEAKMLTEVTADINGDGKYTLKEDMFGIFGMSEEYASLCVAGGCLIIRKDENDIPYLAITDEAFINTFEKAVEILGQSNVFANFRLPQFKIGEGDLSTFTEGRALFFSDVLFWLSGMRNMEDDFAILPRPKYDESQETYYSSVHESAAIMGIPVTSDPEKCGYLLETLACESYKIVIPAYYDVVLSQKFARDADSIEMLDIIFRNRVSDLGTIYDWGGVYTQLRKLGEKSETDVASLAAKVQKSVDKKINEMVEAYQEIGN